MSWTAVTDADLVVLAGGSAPAPVDGTSRLQACDALAITAAATAVCLLPASWFDNCTRLLLDATLTQDEPVVHSLRGLFRQTYARLQLELEGTGTVPVDDEQRRAGDERRGRLLVLGDLGRAAAERVAPAAAAVRVEPGSHAERFLFALAGEPGLSSRDICDRIRGHSGRSVDEAVLSRLGRKLLAQGLVDVVRTGRRNSWDLTPRGEQLCTVLTDRQRRVEEPPDAIVFYPGVVAEAKISVEIERHGHPDLVEVLSQKGAVQYQSAGRSEGGTADDSTWTVGEVATAGPEAAPNTLPVDGVVYEKVGS